jgi:hypothetical protein
MELRATILLAPLRKEDAPRKEVETRSFGNAGSLELDYIANTMIEFATSACEHLKVL